MGRVIGIDYGASRIGVAMSDESRRYVFPRKAVHHHGIGQAINGLRAVTEKEPVDLLVAGLPRSLDGTEGPQAQEVRTAVTSIATALGLPLAFEDERLTSSYADRFKGGSFEQDSIAAATILESYLERTRRST